MSLSTFETLQGAFQDLKKNPKVLVGAAAIGIAVTSLVATVGALAIQAGGGTAALVAVVALNLIVGVFFSTGMVGLSLKVTRGQRPKISDLFAHGSSLPRALAGMISHLILGVGATAPLALIPSVGPVLWVVAALFVLSLTCLAPFYLVDKKQGPLRALWSSVKETGGNRMAVMGILFLSTLLMGVSALVPFLGPLVTSPIFTLALARAYTTVNGESQAQRRVPLGPLAPSEPPLPAVSEAKVQSTLRRFEDELRADGKLAT